VLRAVEAIEKEKEKRERKKFCWICLKRFWFGNLEVRNRYGTPLGEGRLVESRLRPPSIQSNSGQMPIQFPIWGPRILRLEPSCWQQPLCWQAAWRERRENWLRPAIQAGAAPKTVYSNAVNLVVFPRKGYLNSGGIGGRVTLASRSPLTSLRLATTRQEKVSCSFHLVAPALQRLCDSAWSHIIRASHHWASRKHDICRF
jgi:hypothetical protein